MTFALRLLLCVFLALNISSNVAKKPILRIRNDNDEALAKLSDVDKDEDKSIEKNDGKRYVQEGTRYTDRDSTDLQYTNKKPILIFDNNENFEMLRAVDQLVDSGNEDAHNKKYNKKYDDMYTQKDDSYEEDNDNRIEDSEDSRIEDRQSVEDVQNERINKLLGMLLIDNLTKPPDSIDNTSSSSPADRSKLVDKSILGNNDESLQRNPNKYNPESFERDYSLEPHSHDRNSDILVNLLSYIRDNTLRKKSSLWESCGKKAAKYCKKACEDVVNSGCYGKDCKKKAKKRLKRECKSSCNDRFHVD